jgi:hypothetical protein
MDGPGENELATDYMTNYIIFGRNQFHVDNIGHYLAGHEPGNFGLFHLAKERDMALTINPLEIPLYEWHPVTGAVPAVLSTFQRYPLKTYYLQRNYNGQSEPYWHLVNEPFTYEANAIINNGADGISLYQNYPNPVQYKTNIRFRLPGNGHVLVEVINDNGKLIDVLINSNINSGIHSVYWNSSKYPSGFYICRLNYGGFTKVRKMVVMH